MDMSCGARDEWRGGCGTSGGRSYCGGSGYDDQFRHSGVGDSSCGAYSWDNMSMYNNSSYCGFQEAGVPTVGEVTEKAAKEEKGWKSIFNWRNLVILIGLILLGWLIWYLIRHFRTKKNVPKAVTQPPKPTSTQATHTTPSPLGTRPTTRPTAPQRPPPSPVIPQNIQVPPPQPMMMPTGAPQIYPQQAPSYPNNVPNPNYNQQAQQAQQQLNQLRQIQQLQQQNYLPSGPQNAVRLYTIPDCPASADFRNRVWHPFVMLLSQGRNGLSAEEICCARTRCPNVEDFPTVTLTGDDGKEWPLHSRITQVSSADELLDKARDLRNSLKYQPQQQQQQPEFVRPPMFSPLKDD